MVDDFDFFVWCYWVFGNFCFVGELIFWGWDENCFINCGYDLYVVFDLGGLCDCYVCLLECNKCCLLNVFGLGCDCMFE